nr:MAG: hypothetical protein DIU64_13860 [Caldicoprobacter oshimai]
MSSMPNVIRVQTEQDRDQLAIILIRAGYKVWAERNHDASLTSRSHYVYWEDISQDGTNQSYLVDL